MLTFSVGTGRVHALAYTPDSLSLVVDVRGDPQPHPWMGFTFHPATELVWWDIATGTAIRRFRLRDVLFGPGGCQTHPEYAELLIGPDWAPAEPALDVALSPSMHRGATVWEWTNKEDGVCTFDVDGLKAIDLWVPYKSHTARVVFAPDGMSLLAATVHDMDGSTAFHVQGISQLGVAAGTEVAIVLGESGLTGGGSPRGRHCVHPFRILAGLAFDGRFVAAVSGDEHSLLLWDSLVPVAAIESQDDRVEQWEAEESLPGGTLLDLPFAPQCVAFAPGGSRLAAGGAGIAFVTPLTLDRIEHPRTGGAITAVAFGADGRELLAGTEDGTVEVWDADAGQLLREFDWKSGPVSSLAVAPDGTTFAAGTEAGQVIVWDREG